MSRHSDGLREAARLLEVEDDGVVTVATSAGEVRLPVAAAKPLSLRLRACAELIDRHGGIPWGLLVSDGLELAGVLLGEDLGHNR